MKPHKPVNPITLFGARKIVDAQTIWLATALAVFCTVSAKGAATTAVAQFAVINSNFGTDALCGYPTLACRQNSFQAGQQSLGLFFQVQNLPANSTFRFLYVRPNRSIAYDTGAVHVGNTLESSELYWYAYPVNLNAAGKWRLWLEINGSTLVRAPFTVAVPSSFSLSPSSVTVSANASTGTVNVTAQSATAPWTATSNASWIAITSRASRTGNGTVAYSVAANTSTSARTGTLTIAGLTFTVSQAAAQALPPPTTTSTTRTWTYTWANDLLTSVQGPRTDLKDLTTFSYDSSGGLTSVTNALGQVTKVTQHTPGGLPQTIVDPNGVATNLTYDARLRLTSSTIEASAGPLTTKYSYDPAGDLVTVTQPDGSSVTSKYDAAHRLTGVSDLLGQSTAYTLDAMGDRTQIHVLDTSGNVQRNHAGNFDSLGRMIQDVGGVGQATSFAYDANGNASTITDPLKRVTQRAFDELNRLKQITDPAGGVTQTAYDAHDRPTSVTDANGAITTYTYDGFGDVIQRVSPDTGTTTYAYDAGGNLIRKTDATGAVANYAYDALNRLTAATFPANTAENVSYTYDQSAHGFGTGRLTSVTDAAGTLNRSYDERGNVVSETRKSGSATLLTTYSYDAASRIASIKYPSGWTVAYLRDSMGRTTSVSAQAPAARSPQSVLSNIGYEPLGPVKSLTFGNGVTEERSFDLDYRLTKLADAGAHALQNLTYGYDSANNVLSIADGVTSANSQSFGYDALDRLIGATGSYGKLGYTYDSVGNRLTATGPTNTTYSYAAHSNRLISITGGRDSQNVGYTQAGNINSFNPGSGVLGFAYNQAGRLAGVTSGTQQVAQYTYDAFGQRLVKSTGTVALRQYDLGGHLLEESDGKGNPQADYVYLDDTPIATISPSTGNLYFLHVDRLGTPQLATDTNQKVQWMGTYQPFGAMTNSSNLIVQDLRLPGQEFDTETGLNHNGFRDYVPGWGRYVQSDPIGLGGGMNTYGYVYGNPLKRTDKSGTQEVDLRDFENEMNGELNPECYNPGTVCEPLTAPGGPAVSTPLIAEGAGLITRFAYQWLASPALAAATELNPYLGKTLDYLLGIDAKVLAQAVENIINGVPAYTGTSDYLPPAVRDFLSNLLTADLSSATSGPAKPCEQ